MRTYLTFHPNGELHVDAAHVRWTGGTTVRVSINDSSLVVGGIDLHLKTPQQLIDLGEAIKAEGVRLQACNPLTAADPDDDDEDDTPPFVPSLQPESVRVEEATLPL